MKNFNGYDLFHHVRNPALRTYNRVNTYLTIRDRHGVEVAANYLRQFNKKALEHLFKVMRNIDRFGYEQYRRDFMRSLNG